MKQYYVKGVWCNVYLYTIGFDYLKNDVTPYGVERFYYEDTPELRKAIEDFHSDEWLQAFIKGRSVIIKDILRVKNERAQGKEAAT